MKIAATFLAFLGCSTAVSLDTRSVASLENMSEESIDLEAHPLGTYPAKDSASYISPYATRDHAWSDAQQTVVNGAVYCAGSPAGYTAGLSCDTVDDDRNRNLTPAQTQALADLAKKLADE